jgi:hypothetical protein
MLAARCGMLGWDIGENTITKIETQLRCLVDFELLCLAQALDVDTSSFLPASEQRKLCLKNHFRGKQSKSAD